MKQKHLLFVVILTLLALPLGGLLHAQEATAEPVGDLAAVKTYLLEKANGLADGSKVLTESTDAYYELAEAAGFDYAALWAAEPEAVTAALDAAKTQWIAISPVYEQMEGIVAGVPSLAEYDAIIDASPSGEEDPENAADFSVTLPDATVLEKPGNLFGLLEASLWGTNPAFDSGVEADLDADGEIGFGDVLPDANFVKGVADSLASYADELLVSSEAWEPNESDAFTALVVMVPTMSEYFGSWKTSRFVAGDAATGQNFAVISRLSDINDILSSLQVIYEGVGPMIEAESPEQFEQINQGLVDLKTYVLDILEEEQGGKQFSPEEADIFGSEAQDRAQTITGQIAQAAALLDIPIQE